MPLHLASPNSPRINASTEREHRDESAPKELGAAKAGAEREADHRAEERADEPIDLSIARDGGALSEKGPAQAPTGSHEPIKEMKAIEGQIEDKQMVEVEDETKHAVKSERAQGKQPLRDEGTDDDLCLVAPPSAPLATGEDGGEDSDDEVHFQGRAGSVALSDFPCAAARSHLPHIRPLSLPLTCRRLHVKFHPRHAGTRATTASRSPSSPAASMRRVKTVRVPCALARGEMPPSLDRVCEL